MNTDEIYMARCLELAQRGLGNTYSNPMVGSVIVHRGKIIGEGFHHKAGEPHAEVNAVNSVKDKSLLMDATLYVNLEPCAHYGKTPPCSLLIIQMGIPRVVIGCTDTFSEVAGKGIAMMMEKGINIKVGVLEMESRELNKRFFTFHEKKRPYVILKWAETEDGFIDIDRETHEYGQPTWITNELARKLVHKWRREEQSILVGTNTAIADNPSLTVRDWESNHPVRVLIDRQLRVLKDSNLLDGTIKTIVITELEKGDEENVLYEKINFSNNIIPQILRVLYKHKLQSVIIEGGQKVLQSFIDANLWDEARRFIGNVYFKKGIKAPVLEQNPIKEDYIGNSRLIVYRNYKTNS